MPFSPLHVGVSCLLWESLFSPRGHAPVRRCLRLLLRIKRSKAYCALFLFMLVSLVFSGILYFLHVDMRLSARGSKYSGLAMVMLRHT